MEEEEDDQEWPEEEEMGATSKKHHEITAPGMSEITSVSEFKESCASLTPHHLEHLKQLQSPVPQSKSSAQYLSDLAERMGVSTQELKKIRRLCK